MKGTPKKTADDLIDTRTREEAQLERLRECLALPCCSEGFACMVFAGFFPNKYRSPPWETLPGQPNRQRMNEHELAEYMDDRLTYVGEFIGGEPRPPADWLRMGRKNGFTPNWLPDALCDEICRRFLPQEILDHSQPPMNKMKVAQIRKGLARSKSSTVWRSIEQQGHPVFLKWWKSEPEMRPSKEALAEAIREEVIAHAHLPRGARDTEEVSLATIKSHIRRWIIEAEGRKPFQGWLQEPSSSSIAELAETIRQKISLRTRDRRHVPSAAKIQRRIEQWRAEEIPKGP